MSLSIFPNNSDNINSKSEQLNKIPISQLIKLCGDFKLTCLIKVKSSDEQGFIFLKNGEPNNIKTESEMNGEKAFIRILEWENNNNLSSIIKKEREVEILNPEV